MRNYSSELRDFCAAALTKQFVILDTETTGLEKGEVVQIAIIDHAGKPLLHTYVRPKLSIPAEVTAINGITNEMVADAPTWSLIRPAVLDAIRDKYLLIYNANYDLRVMRQSDTLANLAAADYHHVAIVRCVMLVYAEFWGEWSSYRHSYKWQSLMSAAAQQGIHATSAHDALQDCKTTLAVIAVILASMDDKHIEAIHNPDW